MISSSKKVNYIIFVLAIIGAAYYWTNNGFDIHKEQTFLIICFLFGFLCYQLYRFIGFGDKLSRAMIAAQGNEDANADIQQESDKGFEKWKSEKK